MLTDSQPRVVQVTLTNRCQCACRHCGVTKLKQNPKYEPTLQELDAIFTDLKKSGTKIIDLFGGEPTIRQDIFEIISLGRSHGFMVLIETNGFLLDEVFVRSLKSAGLNRIYISLDDYIARNHDANRGRKGLFTRVVKAIELCRQFSIPVDVSIVPPNEEYFYHGHMNRFCDFVLSRGADKVRILLPRFTGNMQFTDDSPFTDGNEQGLVRYIRPRYLERVYFHSPDTPDSDITRCSAKQFFCHITTTGDVLPCPYLPLKFGNIKQESISGIFARIQSSEVMKIGAMHCLARDIGFVKKYLVHLKPDQPYLDVDEQGRILLP